jgi:zinc transport system substrate-binding protein
MRLAFALALALLATALPARAREQSVPVLASIKPVHSIASAVMEGAGTPELLLAGGASPHSYALRPSDAEKLSHARVIFWIGPELETFLVSPLKNVARGRVVALGQAPGVTRLAARQGGLWDADADGHEHGGGIDGHLWLNPANGAAMAQAIAAALAAEDPARAALYRGNAQRFTAKMTALDAELAQRLRPLKGRPYIVLHDAFHYFESRYGLTPAGAVTVAADRPVGARRIADIRGRINQGRIACVVLPPQFPSRLADALTEGSPVRRVQLDDLGAALPAGPGLYEALLRQMGAGLASCLTP